MEDIVKIWSQVLNLIKEDILPVSYSTWIETITPVHIEENTLILEVPYEFNKTIVDERYTELIKNALLFVTNTNYEIDIRIKENKKEVISSDMQPAVNNKPISLNHLYTFDNFVKGDSNIMAYTTAQAVAKACIDSEYCDFNPLFIFGSPGLGKTHLMQAVGHEVFSKNPGKTILYVTSEQFANDFINALKDNDTQSFKDKYRSVDLLMIDDIQFISNMMAVQKEFHHTFNELYQNNKIIIISGDRPPKELHGIEERLITRFESGTKYKIDYPDYETRIAILQKKAERLNVVIPDEVYKYIATNINSSNRELEGAMKMVVSYHRLMKRDINLQLAEDALKEFNKANEKVITPELIIDNVEKYFNLDKDSLSSNSKVNKISYPRQIAMYLIYKLLNKKHKETGSYFGGKDHSTVIHAINKIENDIKTQESKNSMIEDIIKNIKN